MCAFVKVCIYIIYVLRENIINNVDIIMGFP